MNSRRQVAFKEERQVCSRAPRSDRARESASGRPGVCAVAMGKPARSPHSNERSRITRARLGLAVAAFFTLSGCGTGDVTPAAPTQFVATQDPTNFDWINFSWTPTDVKITGYEAEGRMGTGTWQSVGGPIPPDAIGGTAELDSSVAEITDFSFRIRSVNGSRRSAWSNEAAYRRGLRWPVGGSASVVTGQGVQIDWQNGSTVATAVRIDRLLEGTWQALISLPPTDTKFLDVSPPVGPSTYRLITTAGTEESLPTILHCAGFPPTPVFDLTATTETSGIRIRWSNPPGRTAGLVVYRASLYGLSSETMMGPVSPLLPAGTQEYLDPAAPGVHRYAVRIRFADTDVPVDSATVMAVANPTGTPTLLARWMDLPEQPSSVTAVARDSQGRLALAIDGNYVATGGQRIAFLGAGTPPGVDLGSNFGFAAPSVAFDPLDHPHAMVLRPVPGQPALAALVHAWHDGIAWQEEEVARRSFDDKATVRFTVGRGGELSAAWTIGGSAPVTEFAFRGVAGWISDDLTAMQPPGARLAGLEIDGSGVPTVLLQDQYGARPTLLSKAGAWTAEEVPFGSGVIGGFGALYLLPAGIGVVQYRVFPPPPGSGYASSQVVTMERVSGTWSAESLVREYPVALGSPWEGALGARSSPDGSAGRCGSSTVS